MRSASLSFVKHAVKERWKTTAKLNKHIQDARKSVAARYLQLKSNHAVTGVHLLRINKVQDARCWWCGGSKQTVAHLMLECREWRRERETMLQRLNAKNVTIGRGLLFDFILDRVIICIIRERKLRRVKSA
jgi:hypothetical protein